MMHIEDFERGGDINKRVLGGTKNVQEWRESTKNDNVSLRQRDERICTTYNLPNYYINDLGISQNFVRSIQGCHSKIRVLVYDIVVECKARLKAIFWQSLNGYEFKRINNLGGGLLLSSFKFPLLNVCRPIPAHKH